MTQRGLIVLLGRGLCAGVLAVLMLFCTTLLFGANEGKGVAMETSMRIRQLLTELEIPDNIEAQKPMDELVQIGRPAIKPLVDKIFDPETSPKIQFRAILTVAEIAARQPGPLDVTVEQAFIRMVREHPNFEIRLLAAGWLVRFKGNKATPILIEALSDPDEAVRQDAILALRKLFKQDFDYRADAPEQERQQAITKWKNWWDVEGSKKD